MGREPSFTLTHLDLPSGFRGRNEETSTLPCLMCDKGTNYTGIAVQTTFLFLVDQQKRSKLSLESLGKGHRIPQRPMEGIHTALQRPSSDATSYITLLQHIIYN